MEQSVARQGYLVLTAVAMGAVLALIYDLLRGLRRLRPSVTWLMDLIFGLCLLTALIWFLLVPGDGMLRAYDLLAAGGGAGLWFGAVTPCFLPLWQGFLQKIGRLFRLFLAPFTKILKIIRQITKKCFSLYK